MQWPSHGHLATGAAVAVRNRAAGKVGEPQLLVLHGFWFLFDSENLLHQHLLITSEFAVSPCRFAHLAILSAATYRTICIKIAVYRQQRNGRPRL